MTKKYYQNVSVFIKYCFEGFGLE